jgi:hypothetical protein
MENTKAQQTIPWEEAARFATEQGQDFMIALLWSEKTEFETVLTWGRTLAQSEQAANLGNKMKVALGWDPKDCTTVSAKVQALINANDWIFERCKDARTVLLDNFGLFGGGPKVNEAISSLNECIDLVKSLKENG